MWNRHCLYKYKQNVEALYRGLLTWQMISDSSSSNDSVCSAHREHVEYAEVSEALTQSSPAWNGIDVMAVGAAVRVTCKIQLIVLCSLE